MEKSKGEGEVGRKKTENWSSKLVLMLLVSLGLEVSEALNGHSVGAT